MLEQCQVADYHYCYFRFMAIFTMAVSNNKHNATVSRPSVCTIFFLTLIEHTVHIPHDSPGGSMRGGQCTLQPDNKEDQYTGSR